MSNEPQDVAKIEPTGLPVGLSVDELVADSNKGGKLTIQDISIPYLYVLQSNSPQINPDHQKYIPGATAGMLYLTSIEKVFNGREAGLELIFCHYERVINEWIDRDKGGGLVNTYTPDHPVLQQAKPDADGKLWYNDHQIIDTAYHYPLIKLPTSGRWIQGVMPLKSTAHKASRNLNSEINDSFIPGTETKAPRFLWRYLMKTLRGEKKGYVFSDISFKRIGQVETIELYRFAREYADIAAKGFLRRAVDEAMNDPDLVGGHSTHNEAENHM